MAFFSLNPEQMKKYVDSVNEYSSFLETERNNIRKKSEGNGDPVPTMLRAVEKDVRIAAPLAPPSQVLGQPQSSFSPDLGLTPNTNQLVGLVSILSTAASELQVRYNEVVYLNSQGVSSYNADGTLSYYLPDPPEGQDPSVYWATMDTAANVTQYNSKSVDNGKNAAQRLEKALNSGDEAAANKELAEINKHRDVPAYSSMFCRTMGVADMLDAPLKLSEGRNYVIEKLPPLVTNLTETFGHMMAAASTLYDDSSSQPSVTTGPNRQWSLRDAIYEAVTENGGRTTVLDACMTAEGTVYDTEFLVDLATKMEGIKSWPEEDYYGEYYLPYHTTDPLAAVLHGMGNNPKAANAYLAPPDIDSPMLPGDQRSDDQWAPSPLAQKRMEMLASRKWGQLALEGLSAAFASVSSERLPAPGDDRDDRATWATANGLNILAQQNLEGRGTSESLRNTGVMLGNCGPEVTGAANQMGVVPDAAEPYKMVPITVNGGDASKLNKSVARLMLDVSSSGEATYEVVRGATAYAARRADASTQTRGADRDDILRVYQDDMSVIDLYTSLNENNSSSAYNGAAAAAGILSIVPGPGQVAGIASAIASAGLTLSGQPEVDPGKSFKFDKENALNAAAYTNAISAGLIDHVPSTPEELSANTWYSVDSNGKAHVSLDDSTKVTQFNAWVSAGAGKNEPTDYNGDGVIGQDEKDRNTSESKSSKTVSSFRQIGTPAHDWKGVNDFKEANHL